MPANEPDRPVSHRSTTALLVAGFALTVLSLLARAVEAETETTRFVLVLATVSAAWAGVALLLAHRRWVRSLRKD